MESVNSGTDITLILGVGRREEVFTKLNETGVCDKRMSTSRREREQSSRRVKINVDEAIDVIEVKGCFLVS